MAKGVEASIHITLDALFALAALASDTEAFGTSACHASRLYFAYEVLTGTWKALMQRRADLVIAAGPGPAGGGYKTYPIGSLSFVFCVAPTHPLACEKQPLGKNRAAGTHGHFHC